MLKKHDTGMSQSTSAPDEGIGLVEPIPVYWILDAAYAPCIYRQYPHHLVKDQRPIRAMYLG